MCETQPKGPDNGTRAAPTGRRARYTKPVIYAQCTVNQAILVAIKRVVDRCKIFGLDWINDCTNWTHMNTNDESICIYFVHKVYIENDFSYAMPFTRLVLRSYVFTSDTFFIIS